VNLLILVVDDEPDVEVLFRQQFRHDLRAGRFTMEFAQSGAMALQRITDAAGVSIILILSDINMPTTIGLDIAKSVFQVHGVDAAGQVIIRPKAARTSSWRLPPKYLLRQSTRTRSDNYLVLKFSEAHAILCGI